MQGKKLNVFVKVIPDSQVSYSYDVFIQTAKQRHVFMFFPNTFLKMHQKTSSYKRRIEKTQDLA